MSILHTPNRRVRLGRMLSRWWIRHARRMFFSLLLFSSIILSGCGRSESKVATKPAEPAHVDKRLKEEELNRIVLTPLAEERLRLKTVAIQEKNLSRSRQFGGEVVLPPDASLVVYSPFAGRLELPANNAPLVAGNHCQRGDILLVLTPVLSPERDVLTPAEQTALAQAKMQVSQAKIDADGQVKQAQAQLDAATIALRRAEDLFKDQAGTAKGVDDARATRARTKSPRGSVRTKKAVADINLEGVTGKVTSVPLPAPKTGQIRNVFAVPGEIVPAGSPLFEVTDFHHVWVRVPIYAGEVGDVVKDVPGIVTLLSDKKMRLFVM